MMEKKGKKKCSSSCFNSYNNVEFLELKMTKLDLSFLTNSKKGCLAAQPVLASDFLN